jgi:gliding motility-associatede transport system auxiliary component
MDASFRGGLLFLLGLTVLAIALTFHAILLEPAWWTVLLAAVGAVTSAGGAYALRAELAALVRRRRVEIALETAGIVGVVIALVYLAVLHPFRFDLTEERRFSLSEPTVAMLKRLERPVHVVFFHDPMMRETVELYELIARQTPRVTVEFFDPMLQPAQARMFGVNFAGTAVMESEGRRLQVNGGGEVDIANGILRVSQAAIQRVCFLDGHGEPDPFSLESHDHLEGAAGHSHGLGARYVLHERHGMAKARHALETMNYTAEKVSLLRGGDALAGCAVLIVAGPKVSLLPAEVAAVRAYLGHGGNAFLMLDPFVQTGLETVVQEYGIRVDDDIVIDEASHFWADMSSPAVSDYNRHQITRDLPLTFFPGARSLSPTGRRPAGTSVMPLVNSSKNSWGQRNRTRVEFDKERDTPGPTTLMAVALRRPVTPDSADAIRLGAADGRPEVPVPGVTQRSRIAVIGDSDFATNSFFHIMGNGTLFLNTVSYLAGQENLIGLQPRTHDLPRVNLTNRQMKGMFFLSVLLVPGLLGLVGTAVWWRQR